MSQFAKFTLLPFSLRILSLKEFFDMEKATVELVRKHFRLNAEKLRLARKAFGVSTDAEAVNRALDLVIEEHERIRIATEVHLAFVETAF
jgi:hypothetical protein